MDAAIKSGTVILDVAKSASFDPADWWNDLHKGSDMASIGKMISKCGGGSGDASVLIGKRVTCHGASGLGSYGAKITKVDMNKGWIEVLWDDGGYTAWKTAKLCWM